MSLNGNQYNTRSVNGISVTSLLTQTANDYASLQQEASLLELNTDESLNSLNDRVSTLEVEYSSLLDTASTLTSDITAIQAVDAQQSLDITSVQIIASENYGYIITLQTDVSTLQATVATQGDSITDQQMAIDELQTSNVAFTSSGAFQDEQIALLQESVAGLTTSGLYVDEQIAALSSSGFFQDEQLVALYSSGFYQDEQIAALQLAFDGVSSSGTSLSAAVATLQSVVIPATGGRYQFDVHPASGTSEVYDLADIQTELTSTRHRVGDCEDAIDDLTNDSGTSKTKSLFVAGLAIGLGSAVLAGGVALAVANSTGSAGFSVANSLGNTAASISNGVQSFTNRTFGDARGIYQIIANTEEAAQEIEMSLGSTLRTGAWQFGPMTGL
jgi:hypothetical protein